SSPTSHSRLPPLNSARPSPVRTTMLRFSTISALSVILLASCTENPPPATFKNGSGRASRGNADLTLPSPAEQERGRGWYHRHGQRQYPTPGYYSSHPELNGRSR